MSRRLAYAPAEPTPSPDLSCQQIWPASPPGGWFRFAGDGEASAFGPLEHIRALHHPRNGRSDGRRHGHVFFGQRVRNGDRDWRQWSVDVAEAPHIAKDTIDRGAAVDFYVSMQAFRGRRRIENLASIGCAFSDIDYRKSKNWAGKNPRVVLTAILATLGEVKIPPPSFVMDTGRGLCLIWLHELLPPAALRRWNLVQDRICDVLSTFEADVNAKDAARVFRVAGSIHSEAERERRRVRLFWIQGSPGEPFRYSFDALADEVLPYTREQVVSLRAERAKRRASGKSKAMKPARRLDRASYGEAVFEDLERLRTHRHADGIIPAGWRDVWLFCASMALAWSCHPQALESEIIRIAATAAGWSPREAKSQMGSVIHRARDAAAGKTVSRPTLAKLMADLRRPAAREDAAHALLTRISDPVTRTWAVERIAKNEINRMSIWVRPGRSETDTLAIWRDEADAALADEQAAAASPSPDRGSLLDVAKLLETLAGTETVTSTGPKRPGDTS